jgi:hypothetical protein
VKNGKAEIERELRVCRWEGRKPNARDRWKAFHRLYRLAHGRGGDLGSIMGENDADECFMVLLSGEGSRFYHLVKGFDSLELNNVLPKEIRKSMVKRQREKRMRRHAARLLHAIFREVPDDLAGGLDDECYTEHGD